MKKDGAIVELVSVIIPVYNMERYILKALESVTKQTYKELEIIIVNDGSTDKSMDVVKSIGDSDERVIIINKINGGIGSALATGIEMAKGTYVTFLDADDYYDERLIESAVEKAKSNNIQVVTYPKRYYNEAGVLIKEIVYDTTQANDNKSVIKYQYRKIKSPSLCRLYESRLIKTIEFPLTSLGIDEILNISILSKCTTMSSIEDSYYNVLLRAGSVSRRSKSENSKNYNDIYAEMFRRAAGNRNLNHMVFQKYVDQIITIIRELQQDRRSKREINAYIAEANQIIHRYRIEKDRLSFRTGLRLWYIIKRGHKNNL